MKNTSLNQLLLEDFTVMQVMLTAIIVGSIGIFSLHAFDLVKLDISSTINKWFERSANRS